MLNITDAGFESEVLNHDGLVMVDFWAAWCGPCKAIAPTVEKIATDFAGKVKVAKVDVDTNSKYADQFSVRGIPALLFFKDGKKVKEIIGFVDEKEIVEVINELIG